MESAMKTFQQFGFWRVGAANPPVKVGDINANEAEISKVYLEATEVGATVVVCPELCLTGYTLGDLVQNELLLDSAEAALVRLAKLTKEGSCALVVGLPLRIDGRLYNAAAVLAGGRIVGVVPKSYLPTYGEFYEQRWFAPAAELTATEVEIGGERVPVGTDLVFELGDGAVLGVEICEDLWVPVPPSTRLALGGANIIANLSASNELVGKAEYRRQLVVGQSARLRCAYVYAGAGMGESSTDVVFSGHALVAENGQLLAEGERFAAESRVLTADVDVQALAGDRAAGNTFVGPERPVLRRVSLGLKPPTDAADAATRAALRRPLDPMPFVPSDEATREARTAEVFAIQATGLAARLRNAGRRKLVLGLSGGLDSTLALLVCLEAARRAGLGPEAVVTVTMPGQATSGRTKSNAHRLAEALGVAIDEVPIGAGATELLAAVKHDPAARDVVYENAQARYRTLVLMTVANQEYGGLVIGTGDLSEIALGWCTFTGDHISHYNVNAGVPKTLVRHVVAWAARQPQFAAAADILKDILDTPVSPELVEGQVTEDLIGPYELHDFFLYHLVRWRERPAKIRWLARQAFAERYDDDVIDKWLKKFLERFFTAQWKRSVASDGPKVGSVALSPRGDWRMPSDMSGELWLTDIFND